MAQHMRKLSGAAAVAALALTALTATLAAAPALAGAALDQAKAACQVGETVGGYLAVPPGKSPSGQARAEMAEVNNMRRSLYMDLARKEGQPTNVVERLTGERQVAKAAASGECYQDDSGWKVR